jgi:hypothetical protein
VHCVVVFMQLNLKGIPPLTASLSEHVYSRQTSTAFHTRHLWHATTDSSTRFSHCVLATGYTVTVA